MDRGNRHRAAAGLIVRLSAEGDGEERRMVTRAERNATNPDLGVLAGRLLFAVRRELFSTLAGRLPEPNWKVRPPRRP
ncbi:hypothetical protein GCM10022380_17510 [Amycolatopsis tucumanensis]|uniref:Uncharacterized protein n=2 Tax=Pseudonocardiaceae TaxID=2070 RepID=A0ABP7HWX7_9PSEU